MCLEGGGLYLSLPSLLEDPHCCRDVYAALLSLLKIKSRGRTIKSFLPSLGLGAC